VHSKNIPIYIQQDATLHSLLYLKNCSTCFRWHHHPLSGAHATISTASGICHTVAAACHYRGKVETTFQLFYDSVVRHTVHDNVHQLHVQTTFYVWKTRVCQCSFRLLMMGGVSPETSWASYKHGIIKFDTLLHIVKFLFMNYIWHCMENDWTNSLFSRKGNNVVILMVHMTYSTAIKLLTHNSKTKLIVLKTRLNNKGGNTLP
jgi:hypothetical protein